MSREEFEAALKEFNGVRLLVLYAQAIERAERAEAVKCNRCELLCDAVIAFVHGYKSGLPEKEKP